MTWWKNLFGGHETQEDGTKQVSGQANAGRPEQDSTPEPSLLMKESPPPLTASIVNDSIETLCKVPLTEEGIITVGTTSALLQHTLGQLGDSGVNKYAATRLHNIVVDPSTPFNAKYWAYMTLVAAAKGIPEFLAASIALKYYGVIDQLEEETKRRKKGKIREPFTYDYKRLSVPKRS